MNAPAHPEDQGPEKMLSQAWSTATLEAGIAVVQGQQVKAEEDDEVLNLEAQLQDCLWSMWPMLDCIAVHVCNRNIHAQIFCCLEEMKRRRAEMAAAATSSPALLPPGAHASETTPQRPVKKAALNMAGNESAKKALFQACASHSVVLNAHNLNFILIALSLHPRIAYSLSRRRVTLVVLLMSLWMLRQ